MTSAARWQQAGNILCVRLDALGDLLMTTPALRALKEGRPGRRITVLTSPGAASLRGLVPEVDDWLLYDAPWMKATAPRTDSKPDLAMIERLAAQGFDASVIFTVYSQNPLPAALFCMLANVPLRLAHCRENPYQLLTDWVPETEPQQGIRHEVRRQLDLVAAVGCTPSDERLSLAVPAPARHKARAYLRELGIDTGRPWALIHPGASAPSRRYPPELFSRAADLLAGRGLPIVFSGGPGERELVQSVQAGMRSASHSLAGRLDLAELAALIETAPVLISNNTGPAHMAAALGTPVVDLYALTNPQHTPWAVRQRTLYHDVPCKYCYKSICPQGHHDCLARVPPEAVARAALELLGIEAPAATLLSPSPWMGEGRGGGDELASVLSFTPHPNPPPQGGREQEKNPPPQGRRE